MRLSLTSLSQLADAPFDDIIDVRAPAEYNDDHLPGAISLPVLDDEDRARVGYIYKQVSPFDARKLGAALVARNAARHLEQRLADRPRDWQPLVYCWRGGQRSGSFALILAQIGWRVTTLEGGYKAWRRLVVDALYDHPFPAPVVLLDGNTGSAKTEVLAHLPAAGVQVLDLEGLALHRGSLFGEIGPQGSQRGFEGRLARAVAALNPAAPVMIEAESAAIGRLKLPPALWAAMRRAPRIELRAPLEERARFLIRSYGDLTEDANLLSARIDRLRPFHAAARIENWQAQARRGEFVDLAADLMASHYDPRYARHRQRMTFQDAPIRLLDAPCLSPEALPGLARQIANLVTDLANTEPLQ